MVGQLIRSALPVTLLSSCGSLIGNRLILSGCCGTRRYFASMSEHARKRPRVASASSVVGSRKICLTSQEGELFKTLLAVREENKLDTQLRVAGGWVRDKLLGRESNDIDIALNDMTGIAFAELVNEHLKGVGKEIHRIGVVKANPEQSKHLETAAMTVSGLMVDFVNLRSEEYDSDSRIPLVRFGTPTDDACRRDFTVNSLFYNINTSEVEDFTGNGMKDLDEKRIRTPLPPIKTFQDDPLRMLRAIRFASRFQFSLDEEIMRALKEPEILEALKTKISRERVGLEFQKMIASSNALHAVKELGKNDLLRIVMRYPTDGLEDRIDSLETKQCIAALDAINWDKQLELAERMAKYVSDGAFQSNNDVPELVYITSLLSPLAGLRGCSGKGKVGRVEDCICLIMRDSLKFRSGLGADSQQIVNSHLEVVSIAEELGKQGGSEHVKLRIGRLLLKLKGLQALTFCLAKASSSDETQALIEKLYELAVSWRLWSMWQEKHLVDGKTMIKVLNVRQKGTCVGALLAAEDDWRILHRDDPNAQENCLKYLESVKDEVVASAVEKEQAIKREREKVRELQKEQRKEEKRLRREAEEARRAAKGGAQPADDQPSRHNNNN
mmetsp:Transcript_6274/g.10759  ORF Transcript_6274/g.10759 Transcript_6274/m.10759 type:complete len:613 (+) Transcript_6274:125-1963(+)